MWIKLENSLPNNYTLALPEGFSKDDVLLTTVSGKVIIPTRYEQIVDGNTIIYKIVKRAPSDLMESQELWAFIPTPFLIQHLAKKNKAR